jgi:hypothetical protein
MSDVNIDRMNWLRVAKERDELKADNARLTRICERLEKCVAEGLTNSEARRLRADNARLRQERDVARAEAETLRSGACATLEKAAAIESELRDSIHAQEKTQGRTHARIVHLQRSWGALIDMLHSKSRRQQELLAEISRVIRPGWLPPETQQKLKKALTKGKKP